MKSETFQICSPSAWRLFLPPADESAMADSRTGSVNGGRSDQGDITIDGVDDNDQVSGYAFTGVLRETQDSVEEFRVTTSNGDADAGSSSGAQVSLITKSGTNRFHGAAYEYFRPSNTVSNDYFKKQAQINSGETNRPPKLIRNIFGGDLGGPIMKNKLFFFANYEGSRMAESEIVSADHSDSALSAGRVAVHLWRKRGAAHTRTSHRAGYGEWLHCMQLASLSKSPRTQPERVGLLPVDARGQRNWVR